MWLRFENVKIRDDLNDIKLIKELAIRNRLDFKLITKFQIYKKSIDARNKDDIYYNYAIDIFYKSDEVPKKAKVIEKNDEELIVINKRQSELKPIIVGAGPAGLFCALTLVENGINPIIIERGKKVEDRKKDVDEFLETGKLSETSNVQFGEGGAGTFSDGKLTTGSSSPLCRNVINNFIKFGAPEEIGYISKPHIGTDNLIKIISNMRNYIIDNGGEFMFEKTVIDFEIANNHISSVILNDGTRLETDTVIFAVGHSARDTFEKMYEKGLEMEKKNFSVGVRIEHKQDLINLSQYGDKTKLKLPPAEYKLAHHCDDGRSCYTFCMCPGGVVMASSSKTGEIVTNGMSKFARDGENANAALLVNVTPEDFKGESPLEGMYFQQDLERKAFELGGGNYYAPIQKVGDFFNNKKTESLGEVNPTYKPGVTYSNLQEILPDFVTNTLIAGIKAFDKKIEGFAHPDAILTGVETRSSSPVRIIRNEDCEANVSGIYPCGEGAGYAGGIMTAAVDGIKCAIKILSKE